MTLLYHDPTCVEHNPSDSHPEHRRRYSAAMSSLEIAGLLDRCAIAAFQPAALTDLARVHADSLIQRAQHTCETGGGYLDADTPVARRSFAAALNAAGIAKSAVDAVLDGKDTNAFCVIRPPGHHATSDRSMGFCLFNNIAVAAAHALEEHKLERILIVDWDVHHGNGTQDIFYEDPRVMFFSMHRHPFYPGTGMKTETGAGEGLGFTHNVPISAATGSREIMDQFRAGLETSAARSRPELVLLSAGFDAHHEDPIGGLRLDDEHFVEALDMVRSVANEYAGGRIVSLLEGGYNVNTLGRLVVDHVSGLLGDEG